MYTITSVQTFSELLSEARRLRHQFGPLVFRGQTDIFDGRIVPSLARQSAAVAPRTFGSAQLWNDILGNAIAAGEIAARVKWYGRKPKPKKTMIRSGGMGSLEAGAVLQHYGGRSSYVDVTSSLHIAIWFAVNEWRAVSSLEQFSEGKRKHFSATYVKRRSGIGYVFALKGRRAEYGANRAHHGDLINLTDLQAKGRMRAQKAQLIFSDLTKSGGDISDLVVGAFSFRVPLLGDGAYRRWKTGRLFPPPVNDPLYKRLLSESPYLPDAPKVKLQRRLLELPEYHDALEFKATELWREYRALDVAIDWPFFHHGLRTAKDERGKRPKNFLSFLCEAPSATVDIRDAIPILYPGSMTTFFGGEPPTEIAKRNTVLNMFLEYGPLQALPTNDLLTLIVPERSSVNYVTLGFHFIKQKQVRGVWLVFDNGLIFARLFGGYPSSGIWCTHGSWFSLKRGKLSPALPGDSDPDEASALKHALSVLEPPRGVVRRDLGYIVLPV